MTHTLHRFGDRKNDYPWLITPRIGVNTDNLPEKLKKTIKIIDECNIKMWGFGASKNTFMAPRNVLIEELMQVAEKSPGVARLRGVCTTEEQLKQFIKKFKDAEVGLSLTVSGYIEDILKICKELGIKPHSINMSLGIWGKKELLPREEILAITSMCGHGMVSPRFVNYLVDEIKKNKISIKAAAILLAKQCPCGIFNVERAEKLLESLIKKTQ